MAKHYMDNISSFYFHFPFCRHLCNYCDFYKHVLEGESQISQFETKLLEQWDHHKKILNQNNFQLAPLKTIYIGGGTPSLWGERGVEFLKNLFTKNNVNFEKNHEFTLEVDPDAWSPESLKKWFEFGVNRVSIGAQAFDNDVLAILDRGHNKKEICELAKFLVANNISFSFDLLIGAPKLAKNRNILLDCFLLL